MSTASLSTPSGVSRRFPKCESCGRTLPLSSDPHAPKQKIVCVGCGATIHGAIATDAPRELLGNILLAIGSPAAKPGSGETKSRSAKEDLGDRRTIAPPPPTSASRLIDAVLEDRPQLSVLPTGKPFLASPAGRGAVPYDPRVQEQLSEEFAESTSQVDAMVDAIERGGSIDVGQTDAVARGTLVQATRDLDLFIKLGIDPSGEGYPGRHSLHVAMLAAGIGARLGWDRDTLVQLGVGCLIHDLGMLKVPNKEYLRDEVLDDVHFGEIAAHPLHTFDLLEDHMDAVPLATRMVAYQIHERCDGTGYPRKRRAPLIHEASKVAAVADVFVALVSPRPHREPLMPYHAMEHMIRAASGGRFDADVVRALLKTVSLYPIGSCLELDDGRVARVLRSNPESYCRPVVEAWRPAELDAPPEIVDLFLESGVQVRRPLACLAV